MTGTMRKALPKGSPQWCMSTTQLALSKWGLAVSSLQEWEDLLVEIKEHEVWNNFPKDKPYGDPDVWAREVFHVESFSKLSAAYLKRKAAIEEAKAQADPESPEYVRRGNPSKRDIVTNRTGGNSTEYTLRRLARDGHAEVLDRIAAGEVSVNQAAIEVGYRKKPTPLDRLRTAWKAASKDERKLFMEEVS